MLVALLMTFVLIAITAFTIDLGMQRSVRRDMQALADVAALDVSRLLDGRTRADIESGTGGRPALAAALADSVANNDTTTLGGTGDVNAYLVALDSEGDYPTDADGTPQSVAPGTVPDAVVVVAPATVDFVFGLAESGSATRTAVATAASTACFGVGSYAARLDTENSALLHGLLGSVLGGSIGVDALSYRGLADADVSLADLAVELGVGQVDGLADATVTFDDLLIAAADVLEKDGNTADANVLDTIAATVDLGTIAVGDLISLSSAEGAAETARVNVFDIVTGAVFVANGTNAVAVPDLALDLGLTGTGLTTALHVIESPRITCGGVGTTNENSQVGLSVDGTLASVSSAPLGLSVTAGDTAIDLSLATATGTLTNMVCGDGTAAHPEGIDVSVSSGLLSAAVTQNLSVQGNLTGGLLNSILPGLSSLVNVKINGDVRLTVSTAASGDTRDASIRVPPQSYGDPVSTGSGDLGLDTASVIPDTNLTITATLLGLPLTLNADQLTSLTDALVAGLVGDVVAPLVGNVNTRLLAPLTELLGVSLGGADVIAAPRPSCGDPRLVN